MTVADLVSKYGGKKLVPDELTSYEQWSLPFFHQQEYVREPYLQMTLQIDITKALGHFKASVIALPGATFTGYLIWQLAQTSLAHPSFRYRKLEDAWYVFDNLPVFTPIAVGGEARFSETLLYNVNGAEPGHFFEHYQEQLAHAQSREEFIPLSPLEWGSALFVGNLPNLQFTGFTLHTSAVQMGRPYFYFGKRYTREGQTYIPLLVTFDHANLDPYVLSTFMEDFEARIAGE